MVAVVVVGAAAALAPGAPLVWPEGVPSSNANDTGAHGADVGSAKHEQKTHSNIAATTEYKRGDADTAFAEAQVGGLIAAIGSRLIEATAKKMMDEFFRKFAEQLKTT